MTEQIQDQISAFVDGELTADECEFLVRRMERDPEFRRQALSYAAIGSALRGEILNPDPDVLRRRIQEALGLVPVPARRPVRPAAVARRFGRPAMGLGIAASVAAAALLVLGGLNRSGSSAQLPSDLSVVSLGERASYVVPQEVAVSAAPTGNQPLSAPIRLTNYLVSHGEYVRGFGRTAIHSDVVGNRGPFVVVSPQPEQD